MSWQTWLLFVTTVFFVSATPGPNMLLAMTHGIHYGVRRTLMTCFGLMTALGLIMLGRWPASARCWRRPNSCSPSSSTPARCTWSTWASRLAQLPQPVAELREDDSGRHGPWALFRRGFLVAMSNPKASSSSPRCFPSS